MPYYNLCIVDEGRVLSEAARDCDAALAIFGELLGVRLTPEDQGVAPQYMLGQSSDNPHWIKTVTPVWRKDPT
jgi:hypothetical protein